MTAYLGDLAARSARSEPAIRPGWAAPYTSPAWERQPLAGDPAPAEPGLPEPGAERATLGVWARGPEVHAASGQAGAPTVEVRRDGGPGRSVRPAAQRARDAAPAATGTEPGGQAPVPPPSRHPDARAAVTGARRSAAAPPDAEGTPDASPRVDPPRPAPRPGAGRQSSAGRAQARAAGRTAAEEQAEPAVAAPTADLPAGAQPGSPRPDDRPLTPAVRPPTAALTAPAVTRRRQADPASPDAGPTTVHVTIGRVEVRATPAARAPERRRQRAPGVLGLDAYLRQRDGGDGR